MPKGVMNIQGVRKEKRVTLLAGNTLRSRAYAQQLCTITNAEVHVLMYGFSLRQCVSRQITTETQHYLRANNILQPDFNEGLLDIVQRMNWSYSEINSDDANADEVIKAVQDSNPDFVIFSGYGGQILNQEHFLAPFQYLHMHPGFLPMERGSTTIYYSLLHRKLLAVTAFFMNAQIDAGKTVHIKQYPIPNKNVDIDQWLDNCIRADCLKEALSKLIRGTDIVDFQKQGDSNEYYIIHPVLKHLALLSLK